MHNVIAQVLKAACAAVVFSLLFVLCFSLIINVFSLPTGCVKPVNQVLKILSVALGGLIFLRDEKGFIKGAAYGALASVLTFLLYGAIGGSLSFTCKFLLEAALGALAGIISGVIAVNVKNKQ